LNPKPETRNPKLKGRAIPSSPNLKITHAFLSGKIGEIGETG